jgi:hypothetical protein
MNLVFATLFAILTLVVVVPFGACCMSSKRYHNLVTKLVVWPLRAASLHVLPAFLGKLGRWLWVRRTCSVNSYVCFHKQQQPLTWFAARRATSWQDVVLVWYPGVRPLDQSIFQLVHDHRKYNLRTRKQSVETDSCELSLFSVCNCLVTNMELSFQSSLTSTH